MREGVKVRFQVERYGPVFPFVYQPLSMPDGLVLASASANANVGVGQFWIEDFCQYVVHTGAYYAIHDDRYP